MRIHVYPRQPGTGYVFENKLIGGAIPDRFITPIREGIQDACTRGVLAGYPIRDVRIELYDGSFHDVDSSELAFRHAGAMAFQDAARKAGLVLLEPVMRVEVVTPHEHIAAVIRDLFGRRGQMHSRKTVGDREIVLAFVPLAELFGYATNLRANTRGRDVLAPARSIPGGARRSRHRRRRRHVAGACAAHALTPPQRVCGGTART